MEQEYAGASAITRFAQVILLYHHFNKFDLQIQILFSNNENLMLIWYKTMLYVLASITGVMLLYKWLFYVMIIYNCGILF